MYLYFYSIFNVGFYVSCYLFRSYYLLILVIMSTHRIHNDLYLYIAITSLYVIVFKLNLNIYGP